jgi:hypothetical protein
MRRAFIVMVAAGVTAGLIASPALASSQTHNRLSSAEAVAVWHSKTRVAPGRSMVTTWLVDVFRGPDGTASQVIKEVDACAVVSGHQQCRLASVSVGFRSLTSAQFTMDSKHLAAAHLDATYTLRTVFPKRPARTFKVTIVAAWTGTGTISRSGGVSTFRSGCLRFHDTFHGRNRAATATGSANGHSLGSTKNASLSTSTDVSIEHLC